MVQLTIKVTKDILERSKMCGTDFNLYVGSHCAIALAVQCLWPKAYVGQSYLCINGIAGSDANSIPLPKDAIDFINLFDDTAVEDRPGLPEFEFTVDVPDTIIERINIDEIRPLLVNHPTLRLIEQQATLPEATATDMYEEEFEGVMQ